MVFRGLRELGVEKADRLLDGEGRGTKYEDRLLFRMSRVKFHPGGVPGLGANVGGRSRDPTRRGGGGKLELPEAPESKTLAVCLIQLTELA
jgi:hypothetical protein